MARRHVIYVSGYDPQGADGYYRLFARSWKRFLTLWPLAAKVGPQQILLLAAGQRLYLEKMV